MTATATSNEAQAALELAERNRQIAYRFYEELWNKGNYDAAPELLHPDHFDHTLPLKDLPQGRDGVLELMKTFRAAFPDLVMSVDSVIAQGDLVAEVLTLRGTHTAPFLGIPATGRSIEVKSVNLCRIEDGLVRERWGASDDLGMLQQLGILPAPGSRGWNVSLKAAAAQVKLKQGGKAGASALGGAVRRVRGKRGE
ncbi:MAG TPA: ester cyclase [Thermomicrobiales bacterium]|nr:ester cyclase [Thermomicrobiales bacterium]